MKAAERRQLADRIALLTVDRFEAFTRGASLRCFPEELLELQRDLEEDIYRALGER